MFKKLIVVLIVIILAGLAKQPYEKRYAEELTERHIMSPGLSLGVYNDLKQSSFAGVLGGLRSVVATLTHLEAHGHFENQEWYDLKKAYQTCTSLDPHNLYYWQSGGWHLAYNAAADAKNDRKLKSVQRRVMEKEFIEQGDEFLRQGAKANPDDPDLWADLGRLWSSPFKIPDYRRSAEAWEKAVGLSENKVYRRSFIYSLARVPEEEAKALSYAREYVLDDRSQLDIPTFAAIYWALSHQPGVPEKNRPQLDEVFASPVVAYQHLHNYKLRAEKEQFPLWGVDEALREILRTMEVPERFNSFTSENPQVIQGQGWNEE
ncbi:MAG: hypothetical protein ACQKBY_06640 [Verrucomicrobiales bacterium]